MTETNYTLNLSLELEKHPCRVSWLLPLKGDASKVVVVVVIAPPPVVVVVMMLLPPPVVVVVVMMLKPVPDSRQVRAFRLNAVLINEANHR